MMLLRSATILQLPRISWRVIAMLLAIICLCYSPGLFAQGSQLQSHHEIQQVIKQHIRAEFPDNIRINSLVGKLDPLLRLKKCQKPLEAFYPVGSKKLGPITLGVRCLSDSPWQIYVPVQVKALGPAVISKRAMSRGAIIDGSDLAIATRELSSAIHGYFTSIDEVKGMEVRHSLANGRIIGPKSLKPRHLVKRGDIVTILAETSGLHIRVKGKALMDGFRGQSIRIRNTRSKQVLQGEVIASRTVRIKL